MSYLENNLLENEHVIYSAKLHWVIFLIPALCSLLAIIFMLQHSVLVMLGYLLFAVALLTWTNALVTYYSSEYGLTNKRVVMKKGFVKRHSLEILLQRVESIQVNQTLPGRLLGYGTVIICGTGGSKDPFFRVDDPLGFRHKVQLQLEKMLNSSNGHQ